MQTSFDRREISLTDQNPSEELLASETHLAQAWAEAPEKFENYIAEKLKSHAEQNIAAALEFIQQLGEAKTFQDVVQIQTEFMQTQLQSFGEQAKEFSEIYAKAGAAAPNLPFHMPS